MPRLQGIFTPGFVELSGVWWCPDSLVPFASLLNGMHSFFCVFVLNTRNTNAPIHRNAKYFVTTAMTWFWFLTRIWFCFNLFMTIAHFYLTTYFITPNVRVPVKSQEPHIGCLTTDLVVLSTLHKQTSLWSPKQKQKIRLCK